MTTGRAYTRPPQLSGRQATVAYVLKSITLPRLNQNSTFGAYYCGQIQHMKLGDR